MLFVFGRERYNLCAGRCFGKCAFKRAAGENKALHAVSFRKKREKCGKPVFVDARKALVEYCGDIFFFKQSLDKCDSETYIRDVARACRQVLDLARHSVNGEAHAEIVAYTDGLVFPA